MTLSVWRRRWARGDLSISSGYLEGLDDTQRWHCVPVPSDIIEWTSELGNKLAYTLTEEALGRIVWESTFEAFILRYRDVENYKPEISDIKFVGAMEPGIAFTTEREALLFCLMF